MANATQTPLKQFTLLPVQQLFNQTKVKLRQHFTFAYIYVWCRCDSILTYLQIVQFENKTLIIFPHSNFCRDGLISNLKLIYVSTEQAIR